MTELIKRIEEAIETGEVVLIKYHGGSKPGTIRQIAPINLIGGDRVRAQCLSSRTSKVFFIDKMEIVDSENHAVANYETTPTLEYSSLDQALGGHLAELREKGWEVKATENHISLQRPNSFFKNGKVRRWQHFFIDYEPLAFDYVWNDELEDTVEDNPRLRERPWTVGGTGLTTSSFKSLRAAADKFLNLASRMGQGTNM
jgi:hypothetical protein